MEKYDYRAALYNDIKEYIEENEIDITLWNIEEKLQDDLWIEDSVTGNGSGSYTFNAWKAEENLCHNLDLLEEACKELGCDISRFGGAEAMDVCIRCYLLYEMISKVISDMLESI